MEECGEAFGVEGGEGVMGTIYMDMTDVSEIDIHASARRAVACVNTSSNLERKRHSPLYAFLL